jgi:hypothetical protein
MQQQQQQILQRQQMLAQAQAQAQAQARGLDPNVSRFTDECEEMLGQTRLSMLKGY